MRLLIETNEMVKVFENDTKFIILQKTLNDIQDKSMKEQIGLLINRYNYSFGIIKNAIVEMFSVEEFLQYSLEFYLNMISINFFHLNIKERYKKKYIQVFRSDILSFWQELKNNNEASTKDRTFIKMFDEIHDYTLKFNKDLFSKNIGSLKGLVRGASGNHLNDYEWMIPKDEFAGFNRWNPKGKAFLYLGYAESESSSKIKNSIVTCCEELRMKNGEVVTTCRFKTSKTNGMLLDFSIDESLVNTQEKIINESINSELEKIVSDENLIEKVKTLKQSGENRKIKRLIKSKINNRTDRKKIERYISVMLIQNIVEAIFLPVDEDKDSYIPFHFFAEYLINKGYLGVIHESTRMKKCGKNGKNVILFNPLDAEPMEGTMKLFTKINDKIIEIDE